MKLTIESTDTMVTLNGGLPARVWAGRTPGGVEVRVFIPLIAIEVGADASELEREGLIERQGVVYEDVYEEPS